MSHCLFRKTCLDNVEQIRGKSKLMRDLAIIFLTGIFFEINSFSLEVDFLVLTYLATLKWL